MPPREPRAILEDASAQLVDLLDDPTLPTLWCPTTAGMGQQIADCDGLAGDR
jgi:hypothetical protein